MPWHAIYRESDGRLQSIASVISDTLPPELTAVEFALRPRDNQMWDEATRTFVPRPAKVFIDRLDDLMARPGVQAAFDRLTATQRQNLRDALVALLGRARFRPANAPLEVE